MCASAAKRLETLANAHVARATNHLWNIVQSRTGPSSRHVVLSRDWIVEIYFDHSSRTIRQRRAHIFLRAQVLGRALYGCFLSDQMSRFVDFEHGLRPRGLYERRRRGALRIKMLSALSRATVRQVRSLLAAGRSGVPRETLLGGSERHGAALRVQLHFVGSSGRHVAAWRQSTARREVAVLDAEERVDGGADDAPLLRAGTQRIRHVSVDRPSRLVECEVLVQVGHVLLRGLLSELALITGSMTDDCKWRLRYLVLQVLELLT